jgi:hypothetical protein
VQKSEIPKEKENKIVHNNAELGCELRVSASLVDDIKVLFYPVGLSLQCFSQRETKSHKFFSFRNLISLGDEKIA